jgi:hypothetical protein
MITPVDTPIETYSIRGVPIHVKREDLCWPYPPLSKARGVYQALLNRPEISNIGVVDTGRSLNGLLVSTIGSVLQRKVFVGYPVYKGLPDEIPGSANRARGMGAEIIGLPANRQFVMRSRMLGMMTRRFGAGNFYVLPTGLRLPETVCAIEQVIYKTVAEFGPIGTLIVPTGTGTHLAGLLRGLCSNLFQSNNTDFVAVMGYERRPSRFMRDLERAARRPITRRLRIVDEGFDYYEVRARLLPPFPANLHYETRAWQWLNDPGVVESLKPPILFWNIGA